MQSAGMWRHVATRRNILEDGILQRVLGVYFFIYLCDWNGTKSTVTAAISGLLYKPWMTGGGVINEMNEWQGKLKYSEETYPSVSLSTAYPT
jgi:hypothetical protein